MCDVRRVTYRSGPATRAGPTVRIGPHLDLDAETRAWVDFMKAELRAAFARPCGAAAGTDDDAAAPETAGATGRFPVTRRPSPPTAPQKTSPAPLRPRAHTRG
ncbi:hypothetical protein BCCH1_27470 [Burkholderia contaminans]|uniref:Uncharacterized protein n=1 Tax=Burkholderia contaminans TaxID=488447 RepID=A0A250L6W8_9BURK|nr:hypothetical protein BCCH1_27470 [Burkholderia contaminans]GLZ72354.1 hypothetical protein Bcon01_53990 [Burkholderia contaminans]